MPTKSQKKSNPRSDAASLERRIPKMARTLLRNSQGKMLLKSDNPGKGKLIYLEEEISNDPCVDFDCAAVGGEPNPPGMWVTIFDEDYVGAPITFAGAVFSQAEVQEGASKCACPNSYSKGLSFSTASYRVYGHIWGNSSGVNLGIERVWAGYTWALGTPVSAFNFLDVNAVTDRRLSLGGSILNTLNLGIFTATPGAPDFAVWSGDAGTGSPNTTMQSGTLFFDGTVTSGGVEYSWQRGGSRWP